MKEKGKDGKVREKVELAEGGGKGKARMVEKKQEGVSHNVIEPKSMPAAQFMPVHKSCVEDRVWACSGMVAHVKAGDSALSFQQRIIDAGFPNVIVTPLGG